MSYDVQGLVDVEKYIHDSVGTEKILPHLITNRDMVVGALQMAAAAGEVMDIVKRLVIYGRAFGEPQWKQVGDAIVSLERAMMRVYNAATIEASAHATHREVTVNTRLLHSVIGMFGECGELAEAMLQEARGEVLDSVNLGEEIGDVMWYVAIGADELRQQTGITFAEWLARNRRKLLERSRNGTVTSKENRDLATERAVLEGEYARVSE